MKVLLIDHHDSFVDMIADYLCQLGSTVVIRKTDDSRLTRITDLDPQRIIIGPGPGHPNNVSLDPVRELLAIASELNIPTLGICLGHQLIAEYFGACVVRADLVAHGLCCKMYHDGDSLFRNVAQEFVATRYHSLIVDTNTLNGVPLVVTARSEFGEIMALRHQSLPLYGVQFHPESVMTESGLQILSNFLQIDCVKDRL